MQFRPEMPGTFLCNKNDPNRTAQPVIFDYLKFKFLTTKIHRILNQFKEEEKKKREEMKKAARAEREKAKKEKMELERAARIQSLVSMNFDQSTNHSTNQIIEKLIKGSKKKKWLKKKQKLKRLND